MPLQAWRKTVFGLLLSKHKSELDSKIVSDANSLTQYENIAISLFCVIGIIKIIWGGAISLKTNFTKQRYDDIVIFYKTIDIRNNSLNQVHSCVSRAISQKPFFSGSNIDYMTSMFRPLAWETARVKMTKL